MILTFLKFEVIFCAEKSSCYQQWLPHCPFYTLGKLQRIQNDSTRLHEYFTNRSDFWGAKEPKNGSRCSTQNSIFLESPPLPVTSVETTAQDSPDRRISLTSSIITSGSPDPVTKSIRIIQQHDPPHFSIMSYVVSCLNFVVKYIK